MYCGIFLHHFPSMQFSPLVNVESSPTVAINSEALALKAKGVRIFNLSAGEPLLPIHPAVVAGAEQAMRANKHYYPPVAGIAELRAGFVAWMNRIYSTKYSPEQCVVMCGGKFGLYAVCQALVVPGSEALVIAPYWVSYSTMVHMFGGVVRVVGTTEVNGWKVSVEDLEKAVTPRTKIIFFNNGGNPTGVLYSREEIAAILDFAKRHDLVVFSDEVYSGLTFEGEYVSAGVFTEYKDRVVVIQSCSKHFGMTGWRVGFVIGPPELVKLVTTIQSQSTTGTSSISQWAALGAVEQADVIVPAVNAAIKERRDVFIQTFSKLFSPISSPAAGLYAFVSLAVLGAEGEDDVQFCKRVLHEGHVALVPGSAFGQSGYVRFSFGAEPSELIAGLTALAKYLGH